MCGIAGVFALRDGLAPPAMATLEAMVSALQHRGPDEFGCYRDRRIGLGHARLSIIDVASGQQPLANEDGTLWVAFNGAIFNYLELREDLAALGHRFRTISDTEVIVHAFEAWGERAFERFNGQFAVALWDSRSETLILARDRLGVRPLYVCEHRGWLYFASEVKALFAADTGITRRIDAAGIGETFTFWTPIPPQTIFEGVVEIEPGHVRAVSSRGIRDTPFWTPTFPSDGEPVFPGSVEEAANRVRAELDQAVRLRMVRADVPVGCYLSGGLDSSLVAALARKIQPGRLCTYSIRFEEAEYDETAFQRSVVQHLETEHREIVVRGRDIGEVFPNVVWHTERPILRTAPAPLFLLSREVRESGLKVVLTGEGADEVFAGYDIFREAKVRRFWAREPKSKLRPRLLASLYPYLARSPTARGAMAREFFGRALEQWLSPGFAHRIRWQAAASLQRLFQPELRARVHSMRLEERLLAALPMQFGRWSPLAQDQYLETRTLLSAYLLSSQGDRMLMAHSVEGRFPFLDMNVTELAKILPDRYKLHVLKEKYVLKLAARDLVPQSVGARRKQPYRSPDAAAFTVFDRPQWVDEALSRASVIRAEIFDPIAIDRLWRKCLAQNGHGPFSNADNMALTGVLSTQLLYEQFVRRKLATIVPINWRTFVDRASVCT